MSLGLFGAAHGDFRLSDPRMRPAEVTVKRQRLLQFADRARQRDWFGFG